MWRKAKIHLGLGDDADYDEYPSEETEAVEGPPRREERERRPVTAQRPQAVPAPVTAYPDEPSSIGTVRPISSRPTDDREAPAGLGETVTPTGVTARPRSQVVRPIAVMPNARPQIVVPASFNEAQTVADKFKTSQPVVMNLQGADRELSRRLIDFSSGLCYGLGGKMERLANQIYLLTPSNVEVSADERRRLRDRGYEL